MNPESKLNEGYTFSDLSYMTDQWTNDLAYSHAIFKNQNEELTKMLDTILDNRRNLECIHNNVNYLQCTQATIEQDTFRIQDYENYLERIISNIEAKTPNVTCSGGIECYRRDMYNKAEAVYITLKNLRECCEDMFTQTREKFRSAISNPIEAIAQIMMAQLDALEQIEMKLEQMKSASRVNDYKAKLALQVYKLKENKMF